MNKDSIYAKSISQVNDFVFDDKVANVFEDMINRSVPGYASIIAMIGTLAQEYVIEGSNVYDLGCSLGAATLAIRQQIQAKEVKIIAVDNSPAMLDKCQANVENDSSSTLVEFMCQDIKYVDVSNASMTVLNFTLQFFDQESRLALLENIAKGMFPGGVLVLSEKICFEDPAEQKAQEELHHAFKKMQGYSDLEISQKRTALENVLISDTLSQHQERLKQAGFSKAHVWFQAFNFVSMIAIK